MHKRLLDKLESRFANGDYYEAHQIYRTIYYRLMRENKYADVYDLLYNGANRLLENHENNSGADLANLLVDTMTKLESSSELNHTEAELIDHIRLLFQSIAPNSPERMQFVMKAMSISFLPTATIRKHFAEVLWKEKNFSDSRLHFIYSSDSGDNCALMLVEYQLAQGYATEVDLMIAQFVLQVLCIKNTQLAHNTFYCYTSNHPQIRGTKPPFMTPLLNFLCFLFVAIDRYSGKSIVFNNLCSLYEKSLNRDPCYKEYLNQIGEIYFGVEKKAQSGGLFSNLFQSLFDFEEEPSGSISHGLSGDTHKTQDVDLD